MSAQRYTGPERREDGHAVVLAKLEEIKEHLDKRLWELELKVNPMHDYFTTAKTTATIVKYLVIVGVPFVTAWATLKGWLLGILK